MPQIGWFELLLIILVAILVIGPKDFPTVLRKIGSWTTKIKKYFSDVQSNINEIANIPDIVNKKNKNINKSKIKDNKDEQH
jgi:sec-independent protein translocase protein TatB